MPSVKIEQSCLHDICENPEDDTPRLVFADWLDEHDDPDRAEAIRIGVRRRQLDELDPEAWVLDSRLDRIQGRCARTWERQLPRSKEILWEFFGGLPHSVYVDSPEALRKHEDAIFSAGPVQ